MRRDVKEDIQTFAVPIISYHIFVCYPISNLNNLIIHVWIILLLFFSFQLCTFVTVIFSLFVFVTCRQVTEVSIYQNCTLLLFKNGQ
ncbi:unnamed protein product, partial [Heterobilharzia americana]